MIMLRNREPLVSIVVPVYNVERYIDKCLDSLFSQSYENMQYIFVNDCTIDNSMKHIQDKMTDYPHRREQVILINHEVNKGLTAARKQACRMPKVSIYGILIAMTISRQMQ